MCSYFACSFEALALECPRSSGLKSLTPVRPQKALRHFQLALPFMTYCAPFNPTAGTSRPAGPKFLLSSVSATASEISVHVKGCLRWAAGIMLAAKSASSAGVRCMLCTPFRGVWPLFIFAAKRDLSLQVRGQPGSCCPHFSCLRYFVVPMPSRTHSTRTASMCACFSTHLLALDLMASLV